MADSTKRKIRKEVEAEETTKAVVSPERIRQAYRNHFDTEDGRIVLEDLRSRFHLGVTIKKRPTGIDPFETHFNEGQRSMYVAICEMREPPARYDDTPGEEI